MIRNWIIAYVLAGSVFYASIKVSNSRIMEAFLKKEYTYDPLIDEYFDLFLDLTDDESIDINREISLGNQDIKIRIVKDLDLNSYYKESEEVGYAGLALGMNDDKKVFIVLDSAYWYGASETEKQALLFHELAHDILNVDHSKDECSFMYPELYECQLDDLYEQIRHLRKN